MAQKIKSKIQYFSFDEGSGCSQFIKLWCKNVFMQVKNNLVSIIEAYLIYKKVNQD